MVNEDWKATNVAIVAGCCSQDIPGGTYDGKLYLVVVVLDRLGLLEDVKVTNLRYVS